MGVVSQDGFYYPPQTIAYAAALFRWAKWYIRVVDAVAYKMDAAATLRSVTAAKPDVVAIFTAAPFVEADFAWARDLEFPYFFFGPALAYLLPKLTDLPQRPPLLLGDPLAGIVPAAEALLGGSKAPGLWWPVQSQPPEPLSQRSLASLPRPAWKYMPTSRYRFLSLYAGRGCDDHCRWCPYRLGQGCRHDQRPPEAVAAELSWLFQTFHKERHIFRDAVFAADRDWVFHFLEELSSYPPVPWECESRPEHFTPKLLVRMHALGCQQVKFGLESASGELLARWGRLSSPDEIDLYLEKVRMDVLTCRQLRMPCRLFVMTGLPGETEDDLAKTDAFLEILAAPYISVKRFHRYPGVEPLPGEVLPPERLVYWEKRLAGRAQPFPVVSRGRRWSDRLRRRYSRLRVRLGL